MMKYLLLFFLFITTTITKAQDALTFSDCLNQALANNLKIKSAGFDERAASYQRRASYGKLLPNVFADAENRNSWGKEIDADTNLFVNQEVRNTEGTVNAFFTLFQGFSVLSSIMIAKQNLEISKTNVQRIKNAVTVELAQRFITALYLQEIIEANEEQIKASDKQLELGTLKFDSGVISESEVFKIRSQKANEELRLLTSQNQLIENVIALKQLMNMPLDKEIVLVKPQLTLNYNVALEEDQESLAERAVKINPLYKISLLEQQKAKYEVSLARAPTLPTITLRLLYRTNYSTGDFAEIPFYEQVDENSLRGIRFYLIIPIFSQFNNLGKIKTSKMRYEQTKVETQMQRNAFSSEVLKAIRDAKTSLKKNESSAAAFEFSQKSYDADALKFELGKININELNTSKLLFNSNQAQLIQAKYELLFNNALIKFYLGEEFSL